MTYDPQSSYADRLTASYAAITNALNSEPILETLSQWGYGKEELDRGMAYHDAAQEIHEQHAVEYAEQLEATDRKHERWQAAAKLYMRYLKLARVVFPDDRPVRTALGLDGARSQDVAGWLALARQFYTNALGDEAIMEALGRFNITREKLTEGLTLVDDLEAAHANQMKETGEAQQATQARQERFDALDRWMSDFLGVARVIFEDEPQTLEALGIVVES